jgi:hypothetical protein
MRAIVLRIKINRVIQNIWTKPKFSDVSYKSAKQGVARDTNLVRRDLAHEITTPALKLSSERGYVGKWLELYRLRHPHCKNRD